MVNIRLKDGFFFFLFSAVHLRYKLKIIFSQKGSKLVDLIAVQQLSSRAGAESEGAGQDAKPQSMSQTLPASCLSFQGLTQLLLCVRAQALHVTCKHKPNTHLNAHKHKIVTCSSHIYWLKSGFYTFKINSYEFLRVKKNIYTVTPFISY